MTVLNGGFSESASTVFSPWPGEEQTTRPPSSNVPARASFRAAATTVPPAVSAKRPSVWASRRMHSSDLRIRRVPPRALPCA